MLLIALEFLPLNGVVNMTSNFSFKAIASFNCSKRQNLEAGCQGVLDATSTGIIDLSGFPQWNEMLTDLEGFSHLWILFVFHKSESRWKPKVFPPRADHKVGVFASRSPYRPNPIGMSAVKIEKIEGPKIFVSGHDLVDETPILDIKPYLSYADSFPRATLGWVTEPQEYKISFTEQAQKQILFLKSQGLTELEPTLLQQLRFHPTDKRRKRVRSMNEQTHQFVFSYRTWRIHFVVDQISVLIQEVTSGYSDEDLNDINNDPYLDKNLHTIFVKYTYP